MEIAGVADVNLKILEESFPCNFVLRGTELHLEGEEGALLQVQEVVSEMMKTYSRKNRLTPEDVRSLVTVISRGDRPGEGEPEPVILYTKRGGVTPRTPGQREFCDICRENEIVFSIGPAGTGKTYLAVAFALAAHKSREVKRIVLSRPAIEAGESLGFLPGDLREKIDPYLTPLYDALHDMLSSDTLKSLMSKRIIEVIPLAYMRGRTLDKAFVILDEAQNCSPMQMKMFLTRLGPNSRAVVTGDVTQIDLPSRDMSGLLQAERILKGIDGIGFAYLTEADVVRHRLVKDIIKAYGDDDGGKKPRDG